MQPDLRLVGAEVHELHSVRIPPLSKMRDATYSEETQAELKILHTYLERLDVMPTQRAALLDVIERWDANEETEFVSIDACGVCGASDVASQVAHRGWHDEGMPMMTCAKHGNPDGSGAA